MDLQNKVVDKIVERPSENVAIKIERKYKNSNLISWLLKNINKRTSYFPS